MMKQMSLEHAEWCFEGLSDPVGRVAGFRAIRDFRFCIVAHVAPQIDFPPSLPGIAGKAAGRIAFRNDVLSVVRGTARLLLETPAPDNFGDASGNRLILPAETE
jgi:hypothetical protein